MGLQNFELIVKLKSNIWKGLITNSGHWVFDFEEVNGHRVGNLFVNPKNLHLTNHRSLAYFLIINNDANKINCPGKNYKKIENRNRKNRKIYNRRMLNYIYFF